MQERKQKGCDWVVMMKGMMQGDRGGGYNTFIYSCQKEVIYKYV